MKEYIIPVGIALVFLGFLVLIFGTILLMQSGENKTESKVFVGGFIGPLPFGFGNDKTLFIIGIALTVLIAITLLLLRN